MRNSPPALSLCMIVRNEAEMLSGCLDSVQGVADEIVIADTGSTDSTREIAARYGARVMDHPWQQDFSEARNASIAPASGEWILWLDADERLRPAEHATLRAHLAARHYDAYRVAILNADSTGGHLSRGHRLFRNRRGIRFSGRVHEQVSPSFGPANARVGTARFLIDHLGYNLSPERMRRKHQRNLELLLQEKRSDPRNAYVRFTLGQLHMLMGDKPSGEREIRTALGENPQEPIQTPLPTDIVCAAHNNLADCALERNDLDEADARCRRSLQTVPNQAMAHLLLHKVHSARGDAERALQELACVEATCAKKPETSGSAVDAALRVEDLWNTMGHFCLKLGRMSEAEGFFRKALEKTPERVSALRGLAQCALAAGRLDEALAAVQRARYNRPEDESLAELASLALLKLSRFDEAAALLGAILINHPEDPLLRKRLAGVLVKAGRIAEARQILAGARAAEAPVTCA